MPKVIVNPAVDAKCDYCGRTDCHHCVAKLQLDIRLILDELEQGMLTPDHKDFVGINDHLRYAWGARDAINALFNGLLSPKK